MMEAQQENFNPVNWLESMLNDTQLKLADAQKVGENLLKEKELYGYLIEQMKSLPNHHIDALEEEVKIFQGKKENIKKEISANEKLQVKLSTKFNALRVLEERMNGEVKSGKKHK